jgi:carbamoyl-phosphate synthase large subunit
VFLSVKDSDKAMAVDMARELQALGFTMLATRGTVEHFARAGVSVTPVNKVMDGRPHIVDALKNGDVHLVINTTEGAQSVRDSASIRQTALALGVPCITTLSGARSAVRAIASMRAGPLDVMALPFGRGAEQD